MGKNVGWNFGLSHTYRVTDDSARARPTRLLRWDSVPAHGLYAGRQGDCEPCHDRSGKVQSVFGLVTIPVNLYSAIERRETLSFNLLHKKDHARIQNKRFCSEEGVEVPWSDVVKGYEPTRSLIVFRRAVPRAERQGRGQSLCPAPRRAMIHVRSRRHIVRIRSTERK